MRALPGESGVTAARRSASAPPLSPTLARPHPGRAPGGRCRRLPLNFNSPTPAAAPRATAHQSRPPAAVNLRSRHRHRQSALSAAATRAPGRPEAERQTQDGAAALRVTGAPAATPTARAVTAPAAEAGGAYRCSRQSRPAPARPGSQTSARDRPRPPPRAPPVGLLRPAPDWRPAWAARGLGGMRALPESGPHAGSVGALDLLQDPLMLRDRAQTLAALRHLGWKQRSRQARPRAARGSAQRAARARRGGAGAGARGSTAQPRSRRWQVPKADAPPGARGRRRGAAAQPRRSPQLRSCDPPNFNVYYCIACQTLCYDSQSPSAWGKSCGKF